jgi:hypothetical protein
MSAWGWKFHVEGTFAREGQPVFPCEAVIESGDRTDHSPFRLRGVGPVAKADKTGRFRSWYVTEGSNEAVARPRTASVYIRVGMGDWEPLVIAVAPDSATAKSRDEMHLDLGLVEIPEEMKPYVQDA